MPAGKINFLIMIVLSPKIRRFPGTARFNYLIVTERNTMLDELTFHAVFNG